MKGDGKQLANRASALLFQLLDSLLHLLLSLDEMEMADDGLCFCVRTFVRCNNNLPLYE